MWTPSITVQLYGDQRARKTREKESVVPEARRRQKDRIAKTVAAWPKNAQLQAVITRDQSASRDRTRQPSDDVIFVGDDASHERGPMFGFNGAGGGGGGGHNTESLDGEVTQL